MIHPIILWENKTTVFQIKEFCEQYGMRLCIQDDGSFKLVQEDDNDLYQD